MRATSGLAKNRLASLFRGISKGAGVVPVQIHKFLAQYFLAVGDNPQILKKSGYKKENTNTHIHSSLMIRLDNSY